MNLKQALSRIIFSRSYPKWLFGVFAVWFVAWAIGPKHPKDFLLEHVFTVGFVVLLVWSYRRFRLSNLSYTSIFIYLCLHVVGAHYTYSEVPYEVWIREAVSWFGVELQAGAHVLGERNQYDRLVHFCFGLLMAYPVREVFVRIVRVRGFWGYYLPLDVMMSLSMLYEVVEWGIAVGVGGDVGESYLGAQGDVWDAQKDMALATLGGLVAMLATAFVNWRFHRDFAAELADSFRHQGAPLGEVRIADMLKE